MLLPNRYDRSVFGGWGDEDGDCQNPRHERLSVHCQMKSEALQNTLLATIPPRVTTASPDTAIRLRHQRSIRLAVPAPYLSYCSSTSRRSFAKVKAISAISPVVRCTSRTMLSFLGFCCTISHASQRPPFVSTA